MEIRESAWLRSNYRKAVILSVSLALSVPIYALIGEVVLRNGGGMAGSPGNNLWLFLGGAVSLALLPFVGVIRVRMLGAGSGLDAVVDQVMVPQNRYRCMLQAVLVSLAICEIPALIGLGLIAMGAGRGELYSFVGWSALLIVIYFPRYGQWQAWYARRSYFR